MSKICVTGGAGFLPSYVVEGLVGAGHRVTVLDDLSSGFRTNLLPVLADVKLFEGSILDTQLLKTAVAGADVVYHFAANANVPRSVENPQLDFDTNSRGTFDVLMAARDAQVGHVIFASSAAVYGEVLRVPITEDQPLAPLSPYGASKAAGEMMVKAFHATYHLPCTTVRIFNAYGPRQRHYVMREVFDRIRLTEGELELLGTGEEVRDYIYADDAAKVFVRLAGQPQYFGAVCNLAGGLPVSIRELVHVMLHVAGQPDRPIRFRGTSWAGDIRRLVPSLERLQALGLAGENRTLESGLRALWDWLSEGGGSLKS